MDEVYPILKAFYIKVPGFKKQEMSFEEALERAEKTKEESQIMYDTLSISSCLCMYDVCVMSTYISVVIFNRAHVPQFF